MDVSAETAQLPFEVASIHPAKDQSTSPALSRNCVISGQ